MNSSYTRFGYNSDRGHAHDKTIKDLHVYPLVADFRQRMGVVPPPACPPLAAGEGLDSSQWAAQEFGNAPLGDQRLSQRLVASAAHLATQPGRAFMRYRKAMWRPSRAITG